jgi:hypothetical protein
MSYGITVAAPKDSEIEEWWEWLIRIPEAKTPLKGGEFVKQNQTKSVICLACTGGRGGNGGADPNIRELTITDMGKEVLVPVFVRAYIKDEGNFGTDEEARQAAIKAVKDAPRKFLQIDNEPCDIYYKETGPFNIKGVPENNILDNPSLQRKQLDYNNAYSAGYWSKVKLPRKGTPYTIKLGGEKDSFKTEVTYKITV